MSFEGGNPLDLHCNGIPHLFIVKANGVLLEEGPPMRLFTKGQMGKQHRETGSPRGLPPKIPLDFGKRIMDDLRQRVEPKTGLVKPFAACMARRFGVSRSTVSRELRSLRQYGVYGIVYERVA